MPDTAVKTAAAPISALPAQLKPVPAADLLLKRVRQLQDEIAARAFAIFENNGRTFGRDLEDLLKAESELLHPIHIDISELDGALTVKAEVPGFTAKDLDVAIEPHRLIITGKRASKEECNDKKRVYTETCSDTLLRVIDLPTGVDTDKVHASLKDGILRLTMPKTVAQKVEITSEPSDLDREC